MSQGWGRYGKAQERAVEVWIDQMNNNGGVGGREVEFVLRDSAIDPTTGTERARELIQNEDVDVIIGPNAGPVRQAVSSVTEEEGIPHLFFIETGGPNAIDDYCNEWLFKFGGVPTGLSGPSVVEYIMNEFGDQIYILGTDYSLPTGMGELIRSEVESRGGTILGEQYVELGLTDFSSILTNIESKDPEVVWSPLTANSALAFMKQAYNQGLRDNWQTVHLALSGGTIAGTDPEPIEGALMTALYFESIENEDNQEFVSKYKDMHGDVGPYKYDGLAYNTVQILGNAVERADSTEPDALKEALQDTSEIQTIMGNVSFPYDNQIEAPYKLGRVTSDSDYEVVKSFEPTAPSQSCN